LGNRGIPGKGKKTVFGWGFYVGDLCSAGFSIENPCGDGKKQEAGPVSWIENPLAPGSGIGNPDQRRVWGG